MTLTGATINQDLLYLRFGVPFWEMQICCCIPKHSSGIALHIVRKYFLLYLVKYSPYQKMFLWTLIDFIEAYSVSPSHPFLKKSMCDFTVMYSRNYIGPITPWSRVLFEKLIIAQLLKVSGFYRTQKFVAVFTRARHWSYPEPD
jgi:hypothetical protein